MIDIEFTTKNNICLLSLDLYLYILPIILYITKLSFFPRCQHGDEALDIIGCTGIDGQWHLLNKIHSERLKIGKNLEK